MEEEEEEEEEEDEDEDEEEEQAGGRTADIDFNHPHLTGGEQQNKLRQKLQWSPPDLNAKLSVVPAEPQLQAFDRSVDRSGPRRTQTATP